MQGYNTHAQVGGRFRTRVRLDVRGLGEAKGIRLAALNISSGRLVGLETALRVLRKGYVDMGILQETKLRDVIYARQGLGYAVWEKAA